MTGPVPFPTLADFELLAEALRPPPARVSIDAVCRDCGDPFTTTVPSTGSKWTSLCWSCLRGEL